VSAAALKFQNLDNVCDTLEVILGDASDKMLGLLKAEMDAYEARFPGQAQARYGALWVAMQDACRYRFQMEADTP
jgi:hypothetical protein